MANLNSEGPSEAGHALHQGVSDPTDLLLALNFDMSMKKAINTIRTKLQEQEEREIGLVTPVN